MFINPANESGASSCLFLPTILKEIQQRDYQDTHREIAPLKMARDSIKLDPSELDIDGVLAAMKKIIGEKIPV